MGGFANAVLGGQNTLIREAIKSPDYVPGVSGWAVFKDGSSEFNDGTYRGDLIVGTLPSGNGVWISDVVPPSLAALIVPQVFTSIIEPCLLMFVNSNTYFFQVVGNLTGGHYAYLTGWAQLTGGYQQGYYVASNTDSSIFGAGAINVITGFNGGGGLFNIEAGQLAYGFGFYDQAPIPGGVMDAALVAHIGTITAAVSAETNIPDLELAIDTVNGCNYWIEAAVLLTCSVSTDVWELRARTGTAVTGTSIGEGDGPCGGATTIANIRFMYQATATGSVNIFFSLLRRTGTGTLQASGSPGANTQRTYSKCVLEEHQAAWRVVF